MAVGMMRNANDFYPIASGVLCLGLSKVECLFTAGEGRAMMPFDIVARPTKGKTMEWTTESIAALKDGYRMGQAAAKIADLLGTTKGSVVGKAHRMGLKHPDAILPKLRVKQPVAENARSTIEEVRSTIGKCQYPHGHLKDVRFHFCGEPVRPDSSYCAAHHAICYRTKSQERDVEKVYTKQW